MKNVNHPVVMTPGLPAFVGASMRCSPVASASLGWWWSYAYQVAHRSAVLQQERDLLLWQQRFEPGLN